MESDRALLIESPGLFTTVQDLGRPGLARFGVGRGGALDRQAHVLGNRLVGNEPGAASLECTLSGPVIHFACDQVIAITGADFGPRLDGDAIPGWTPILARAGSHLSFAASPRDGGARAYLCVAGGIETPVTLGSRSTDLIGHFGGFEGRPLRTGDRVPTGQPKQPIDQLLRRRLSISTPVYDKTMIARVMPGPQADRFTEAGLETFLSSAYTVTAKADRTGIRLDGPPIEHRTSADLISEGIAHGAIQVPGDGQPIVLLAARQTVGGYVKIATVIGADLDRIGQLRPGSELRFESISLKDARAAGIDARRQLGDDAVIASMHPVQGQGAIRMSTPPNAEVEDRSWDPDGVIRVIAAAERAGITHLRLDVASAGVTIELSRGSGDAATPLQPMSPVTAPANNVVIVTAPVLGTFYRRGAPDDPAFAKPGQAVNAGDVLGLIEVMKTYHEVTAPVAGTVSEILADDGHYVEYGQPLIHLLPQ